MTSITTTVTMDDKKPTDERPDEDVDTDGNGIMDDDDANNEESDKKVRIALQNLKESYHRRQECYNLWISSRERCARYFANKELQRQNLRRDDGQLTFSRDDSNKQHDENNNQRLTQQASPSYSDMMELKIRRERLQSQLISLKQECSNTALEVYSLQLRNEERRRALHQESDAVFRRARVLRDMRNVLLLSPFNSGTAGSYEVSTTNDNASSGNIYERAIEETKERVREIRFRWALQAFKMHNLQVDRDDVLAEQDHGECDNQQSHSETKDSHTSSSRQGAMRRTDRTVVRGIGKIAGLPLPHKGPELYGFLPPRELQSALRQVASLTFLVAQCLGIHLPHPILLRPRTKSRQGWTPMHDGRDIVDAVHVFQPPFSLFRTNGTVDKEKQNPTVSPPHSQISSKHQQLTSYSSSYSSTSFLAQFGLGGGTLSSLIIPQASKFPPSNDNTGLNTTTVDMSFHPETIQQRLYHSTATVISEDSSYRSAYMLRVQNPSSTETSTSGSTSKNSPSLPAERSLLHQQHQLQVTLLQTTLDPKHSDSGRAHVSKNTNDSPRPTSSPSSALTKHTQRPNNTNSTAHDTESPNTTNLANNNPLMIVDDFAVSFQLLHNNVIALCIKAGVPVDRLRPAVAVLLNLHELHRHLFRQLEPHKLHASHKHCFLKTNAS